MGSPPAVTLTATGAASSAQGTSDENEIALVASSTESSTPFVQRSESAPSKPVYRVHKRRFFGLAQLILLNIVVSWDVRSETSFEIIVMDVLTLILVAHFLCNLNHLRQILPNHRICHQLAKYRFPLRILRGNAGGDMDAQPWSQASDDCGRLSAATGKLGPLCRNPSHTWPFRSGHVRPDSDRPCATFRVDRTDKI